MTVHDFTFLNAEAEEASRIAAAIAAAARCLGELQHPDGHWCGELEGDTILESEYLLLLYFLGRADETRFRKAAEYIRRQQLANGGWSIYAGGPTDLSASVKAYFCLQIGAESPHAPPLSRPRSGFLPMGWHSPST